MHMRVLRWVNLMPGHRAARLLLIGCLILGAAILLIHNESGMARAQTGGDYQLTWFTLAASGDQFIGGGDYQLGFTLGQEPSPGKASGGEYVVAQGYWQDLGSGIRTRYLPAIIKHGPGLVIIW